MITISSVAKREKNKLYTDSAFIILIDILLGDETARICYNTEDITWNGNLYKAFPFDLGDITENTDGSDPNVQLRVDNVSQALQYVVEENAGANGTEVVIRVVNTKALDNTEAALEEHFVVTKTNVDKQYITFTLGTEYSSRTRRPKERYMKNNCPFQYKSVRCGATSSQTSCNHTLADCRLRNNSERFGGFQGVDQRGVYVHT